MRQGRRKSASVGGAAIVISLGTFFSILINAVKAIVIAKYFGTSSQLDAFFVAMILPLVLSGILVASMQASIIPIFIEYHASGKEKDAYDLFHSYFTASLMLFVGVSLFLIFFSTPIVSMLAPGIQDDRLVLASRLLKYVAPTILMGGACDIVASLYNAMKKFAVPAFGGVVNITISLVFLVVWKSQGVFALVFGALLGSLVHFLYLVLGARFSGLKIALSRKLYTPGIKRVLLLMIPVLLGSTFSNLNITVDQIMASGLSSGSISSLIYANNINSLLAQLFIFSIGAAILPFFSQQIAEGRVEDMKKTFSAAVRMGFFMLMPITVFIVVLGTPVIKVVFERGAFDSSSTAAVSGALKAFALGLPVMSIGITAVRLFTSLQMTRLIAGIAFANIFINISMNAILMRPLGHVGIALSTSITYFFSTVLLLYFIGRRVGRISYEEIGIPALKVGTISFLMGIMLYAAKRSHFDDSLPDLFLLGFFGVSFYIFLCWLWKVEELQVLFRQALGK
jgi:putative peptidoglycan lipid II flippase